jgi:hypothetical protein
MTSRPRFGCYSPVRTGSASTEVADGSAGQVLGGKVASGRQGGLRECGRLNVPINILFSSGRWIDKTVASSHLMYTLRATVEFRDLLESGSLALINLGWCEEV